MRSARSRFAGRSQLQANWVAATVMRRAGSGMRGLSVHGADALADLDRRAQRALAILAADHDRPLAANRRQKGLNLSQQRVTLRERLLFDMHRQLPGAGPGRALADDRQDLLLQIERQIGIVAEAAQLA